MVRVAAKTPTPITRQRSRHIFTTAVALLVWRFIAFSWSNDVAGPPRWFLPVSHVVVNSDAGKVSPACRPRQPGPDNTIKTILVLHMRKSGGSTVWKYFRDVALHYGLEFVHVEGTKHPELRQYNASTFYVTHFREPVARTISHFKFGHRWDCNKMMKDPFFVPTLNNTISTLEKWIHRKEAVGDTLWACSSNCHARWAAQNFTLPVNEMEHRSLLKQAREQLQSFNFIVITNWMKDPKYVKEVEKMFGVSGFKQRTSPCAPEMAVANQKVPLHVANETNLEIQQLNTIDTTLYRELSTCPEWGRDFSMVFDQII